MTLHISDQRTVGLNPNVNMRAEDDQQHDADAFERFQSLTKRLLHVSKDELREAEARDQEKRRTA